MKRRYANSRPVADTSVVTTYLSDQSGRAEPGVLKRCEFVLRDGRAQRLHLALDARVDITDLQLACCQLVACPPLLQAEIQSHAGARPRDLLA